MLIWTIFSDLLEVRAPGFHKLSILMDSTGIRVSLYNAISEKETDLLIEYIKEFVRQEKGRTASGAA
jgi:phosphoserine aminotransferase